MKRHLHLTTMLAACLLGCMLAACSHRARHAGTDTGADSCAVITTEYARGFRLLQGDGYVRADIINPWDTTRLLATYLLIDKDAPLPDHLPQGTVVRTPLANTLVFSSVHCSLLQELDRLNAIGGVCDSKYIYIDPLQQRLRNGTLTDAGSSLTPDMERIIALAPDAILLSPYENDGYARLQKTGIPIIQCADYMETSPLGRAEWMKLFGLLYGCRRQADSLFNDIASRYNEICHKVAFSSHRPTVISERRTGAVWYVPGGKSYLARLFADAGASYPWSDNDNTGSIALSFEEVLERGQDADYWLIKYNAPLDLTYSSLAQEYAPYRHFKAFTHHNIYACNSDRYHYYEETPFHPERLLADLAAIFQPGIFGQHTPCYFHPLAQE